MSEELSFDYRAVFSILNSHRVQYLLVGGLNFYLAHRPVSTQDIDILILDELSNRQACDAALRAMEGQWGKSDEDWGPVDLKPSDWLAQQTVYCLLTRFGPVDIFRKIEGIADFEHAQELSISISLDGNVVKLIGPQDLLNCQLAIPEQDRRQDRVRYLQKLLGQPNDP